MRLLRILACGVASTLWFGSTAQSQTSDKRFMIVLIGPTGSGKTTQAEFLRKRFGIPTIAVDDLVAANPAALAKFQRPGITPGPPQLNPALDELVAEKLASLDLTKGVVLDGYPASKDQADHFAGLISALGLPHPIVIQIDVSDEVATERLKERHHAEDQPELIEERLKNYHREMDMIQSYFPEAKIWTVNGNKPAAEVSSAIERILKNTLGNR